MLKEILGMGETFVYTEIKAFLILLRLVARFVMLSIGRSVTNCISVPNSGHPFGNLPLAERRFILVAVLSRNSDFSTCVIYILFEIFKYQIS